MECWKQGCKNKVKVCCQCVDPARYSCRVHIYEHTQDDSIEEHRLKPLKLKINQKNKEALVEELQKLSKELVDIKENLIKEAYRKIQELEFSLIEALERIEKIRLNQVDLISKIHSIKKIPKINQNPFEKLLSLDPDSARKMLNEFGCSFNCPNFGFNKKDRIDTVENNEIVFFGTKTKSAFRVNLNDFSKSEKKVDILQSIILNPIFISMCLLPDKSIFCYGNFPPSETAFILYPNSTIKQLSDWDPSSGMGAVYHDGFIFLFGGFDDFGVCNKAAKYELSTDKWYHLKNNLLHGFGILRNFATLSQILIVLRLLRSFN
ncbi:unnamed protein product [Blepharisma stoltei]|uniref:Uncharacterized protein n=1 Tax=Blepharisma stoltei TaxID=1481888 RepID=A0AAU9JNT2_9CILI|nr:unnamed protein product [Blepharisma stoltei]